MLTIRNKLAPSQIHGTGVVTLEPIKKGQIVWRWDYGYDKVVSPWDYDSLPICVRQQLDNYSYRTEDGYNVCFDNARFMNHSNDPNTVVSPELNGPLTDCFIASRDISEGEELTCDYRTFDLEAEKKLWS